MLCVVLALCLAFCWPVVFIAPAEAATSGREWLDSYSYELYFLEDPNTYGIYSAPSDGIKDGNTYMTGTVVALYIKTDLPYASGTNYDGSHPDPVFSFRPQDGSKVVQYVVGEGMVYEQSNENTVLSTSAKVDGGYIYYLEFAEAGTHTVNVVVSNNAASYQKVIGSFTVTVKDYDEAFYAWEDELIAAHTTTSMSSTEKMQAVCEYLRSDEAGFRYYLSWYMSNAASQRVNLYYPCGENSRWRPFWQSKQWDSCVSPQVLALVAERIGGFDAIQDMYEVSEKKGNVPDDIKDTWSWEGYHSKCRVVEDGNISYFSVCPSIASGVIAEEDFPSYDFSNTSWMLACGPSKVPLSSFVASVQVARAYYAGSAVEPQVSFELSDDDPEYPGWYDQAFVEGKDYVLSWENNTSAGTGTVRISGIGAYTGTLTATFEVVGSGSSTSKKTGWRVNDNGTKSYYVGGVQQKGVFLRINEAGEVDSTSEDVYYLKLNGEMATGLVRIYGIYRYFDEDGVRQYGAQTVGGVEMFFDDIGDRPSGARVESAFVKVDKESGRQVASGDAGTYDVYYYKADGSKVTGLAKIYGVYRYFGDDGVRRYGFQDVEWSGVINDDGTHADGEVHTMFFDNAGERPSGCLLAGSYIKIDKETGELIVNDTSADHSGYDVYYPRINGEVLRGCLAQVYGYWRCFDENGVRQYGLANVEWSADVVINDKTGAYTDGEVHTMFFDDSGAKPSGVMVAGEERTVEEKVYAFGDDGGLVSVDGVPTTVVEL